MMDIFKNLFCFLLLTLSLSCSFLEGQDKPQTFPNYDYSQIEEIVFFDMKSKEETVINDFSTIERARETFLDENNYYKNQLRKFNGVKPNSIITLISLSDTIVFRAYPTSLKDKIELDFAEKYDPENPMKSRKVYRFYMNTRIMELLGK